MAKIYISSTFEDLQTHRSVVNAALARLGHDVTSMESYVASDERPLDRCLADVAACDVYVAILAWRYGFVPHHDNPGALSITELEFRKAEELGKPRLIFLLRDDAPWPPKFVDSDEARRRLHAFRHHVSQQRLASFFESSHQLAELVATAVTRWDRRPDNAQRSPEGLSGRGFVRRRPFQAPSVPTTYVSRPNAESIASQLVSGIRPVLAIHGLPGVGKTLLASEVAHTPGVRDRFADGVLWATLGQTPDRLSLLVAWIQSLHNDPYVPSNEGAATTFLRTLLDDRRVLLVIDDAWTAEDARPFMVAGPDGGVLVTTRRAVVIDQLNAEICNLDPFSPEEALHFLTARVRSAVATEATLASLAVAVGGHPMALALLAAMLARGFSSELALRRLLPSGVDDREPIQRCIFLSVDWLRERDRFSWRAFADLGILVEDTVIVGRLTARLWSVDQCGADDCLSLLADDALLTRRPNGYVMHDLVRDVAARVLQAPAPLGRGLSLPDRHVAFLRAYGDALDTGRWDHVEPDGYIHRNLTRHLLLAGREGALHALLAQTDGAGSNAWFAFHRRRGDLASFLDDVALALEACRQSDKDAIGLQLRYVLIRATFESLYGTLSPRIPAILYRRRFWSIESAVDFVTKLGAQRIRLHAAAYLLRTVRPNSGEVPALPSEVAAALTRILVDGARHCDKGDYHSALLIASCLHRVPASAAASLLDVVLETIVGRPNVPPRPETVFELACVAFVARGHYRTRLIDKAAWMALSMDVDDTVRALDRLLPACTSEEANRIVAAFVSSLDRSPAQGAGSANEPALPVAPTTREVAPTKKGEADGEEAGSNERSAPRWPWGHRRSTSLALVPSTKDIPQAPVPPESSQPARDLVRGAERRIPSGNLLEIVSAWACDFPAEDWQAILSSQPPDVRRTLAATRNRVQQTPRAAPNVSDVLASWITGISSYATFSRAEQVTDLVELCDTGSARSHIASVLQESGASLSRQAPATMMRLLMLIPDPIGVVRTLKTQVSTPSVRVWLDAWVAAREGDDRSLKSRLDEIAAGLNHDVRRVLVESACQFGSRAVVDSLIALSRIGDGVEQAGAVLSLAPYARFELVGAAMPRLAGSVGRQTEVLTRLVGELSTRLRGEALAEFIEVASRLQSEWWIVEALTILAWQRADVEDLQCIARAARHLRIADLRSRLCGRVASRLTALGDYELAARVADGIETKFDRWKTLADVSASASAVGLFDVAREVASRIYERHERSRALRELAFNLARRSRLAEAREIDIPDPATRAWVKSCLERAGESPGAPATTPAADLTSRSEFAIWRQTALAAFDAVNARHQSWQALEALRSRVEHADEVLALATVIWNSPLDNGQPLYEALAQCDRPAVLKLIHELAPLLAWKRGADADAMTAAIGSVCAWWP